MVKILVLSDSHGYTDEVTEIKKRHNLTYNIHCGDSELAYDAKELEGFTTVAGNADMFSYLSDDETLDINSLKVFVTLGHLYREKSDLHRLSYRSEEIGANIVCFGHSHIIHAETINGVLYINPGSIRFPRRLKEKTYIILTIDDDYHVTVNFHEATTGHLLEDLTYKTKLIV